VAVGKLFVSLADRRVPRTVAGSLPYRRLSGDCSRVLTAFRGVKRATAVTTVTRPEHRSESLKYVVNNVAERLAAGAENC
jgi:hypothetical protein